MLWQEESAARRNVEAHLPAVVSSVARGAKYLETVSRQKQKAPVREPSVVVLALAYLPTRLPLQ